MTTDLKTQLIALEAEFATLDQQLVTARKKWEDLREQRRPIDAQLEELSAGMDAVRHSDRYMELAIQLPHLRKAVGQ
jgi:chromosome segregation ATPase